MEKKGYLRPYKNEINSSASRRIEAHIIDALLLIVISFVLLISSHGILDIIPAYKGKINTLNQEIISCYEIEEEAKIYEFIDNENHQYKTPREQEDIFRDYCLRHILYSYSIDNSLFLTYGIEIENPNNLEIASYESDPLAYFYVNYVPKYNENDNIVSFGKDDPKLFFYKELKNASVNIEMWNFDEESLILPYLDADYAIELYKHLNDKNYQAGVSNYNYLAVAFQNLWNKQVDELINSTRFKAHYDVYKKNYAECSYIIDYVTFGCYLLSFFLTIILPQLIFKDMKTIGKKLLKIKVVDKDGYELITKQKIFRNICSFVMFYGLMLFSTVLSGGLNSGIMYPFFEINGVGFSNFSLILICDIICFISLFFILINKRKRSLQDIICDTWAIDERYLKKDYDVDEETSNEQETFEDNKYFDSSDFNNIERKDLTKKD